MANFEVDYLVVGTGATAMSFVDTLLTEGDATVLMVDKHHRPGGHWNDAYSFVRLHQPSQWYGVESRELSSWERDATGVNAGMFGLATGPEVLAHFDQVMRHRFLPSGRVQWFPKCEHTGHDGKVHRFRSLTTGDEHTVRVRRKWVNGTHAKTEVPSTRPPKYQVAAGVECVPLNGLPQISRPYARYTVVGSGKSGMDACLWLLENGVAHERIRWIMPRDAWLMDRANFQPGPDGWERNMHYNQDQFDAICEARDEADLLRILEERGALLRIDPQVQPTTYRCAVVSQTELAQLRLIGKKGELVRLGHVQSIEPTRIVFNSGSLAADPDTLYVDCTACAIQPIPRVPIFDGDAIHLLMVRVCQPLFSAAVVAWVESHVADPAEQNELCRPVPGPELPRDWLRMWGPTLANVGRWRQRPDMQAWLAHCRLNAQAVVLQGVEITPDVQEVLKVTMMKAGAAGAKLPQLMAAMS